MTNYSKSHTHSPDWLSDCPQCVDLANEKEEKNIENEAWEKHWDTEYWNHD